MKRKNKMIFGGIVLIIVLIGIFFIVNGTPQSMIAPTVILSSPTSINPHAAGNDGNLPLTWNCNGIPYNDCNAAYPIEYCYNPTGVTLCLFTTQDPNEMCCYNGCSNWQSFYFCSYGNNINCQCAPTGACCPNEYPKASADCQRCYKNEWQCQLNIDCTNGQKCNPNTYQCVTPICSSNTQCNDGASCTSDVCNNPGQYDSSCSHNTITSCTNGDGCCANGCNKNNDNDCAAVCGNGVCETPETSATCIGDCPIPCTCTAWVPGQCLADGSRLSTRDCTPNLCLAELKQEPDATCDLLSCDIPPNHLLASETFVGNTTMTISSFRYPVVSFCFNNPVIILDASTMTSTVSTDPYVSWNDGDALLIPQHQVWTVFYIMKNNAGLPTICGTTNESYNLDTGNCTIGTGFAYFCSQGVFDPALGACVIQPDVIPLCPLENGGYYDTSLGVCIWHPPLQANCDPPGVYDVDTQMCEWTPDTDIICPTGSIYNDVSNLCEYHPLTGIICNSPFTYNVITELCEYQPSSTIICSSILGYEYNPITDKCEKNPESIINCLPGFSYVQAEDKCIKIVDSVIECTEPGATYNNATDECIINPNTVPICTAGTLEVIGGSEVCVYHPDVLGVCNLQGNLQIINGEEVCVVEPNLAYLCLTGTLTLDINTHEHYCEIRPEIQYICDAPAVFDESIMKCVLEPGTPGQIEWWHVAILVTLGSIITMFVVKKLRRR